MQQHKRVPVNFEKPKTKCLENKRVQEHEYVMLYKQKRTKIHGWQSLFLNRDALKTGVAKFWKHRRAWSRIGFAHVYMEAENRPFITQWRFHMK